MLHIRKANLSKRLGDIPDGEWRDTGTIHAGCHLNVMSRSKKTGDRLFFDFTASSPSSQKMGST
jgi:hypothetical protein